MRKTITGREGKVINMEQNLLAVRVNESSFGYDIHSLVKAFYPECEVKIFDRGEPGRASGEGFPELEIDLHRMRLLLFYPRKRAGKSSKRAWSFLTACSGQR